MSTVFIGGSIDGQRREVDAHVDRVQVPRPGRIEDFLGKTLTIASATGKVTHVDHEKVAEPVDHYRRIFLPTHRGERRSFFLLAGIYPEDGLGMLLEHYHPGEAIPGEYRLGGFLPDDVEATQRAIEACLYRAPSPVRVTILLPKS